MKKNNGFHVLVQGTIAVTALLALIGAVILHSIPSKSTAGTVLIVMTVICILLLLLELWGFNTQNKKIVSRLATMITRTERDSMYNFPAPTIVINDVNVVVWANRQFRLTAITFRI